MPCSRVSGHIGTKARPSLISDTLTYGEELNKAINHVSQGSSINHLVRVYMETFMSMLSQEHSTSWLFHSQYASKPDQRSNVILVRPSTCVILSALLVACHTATLADQLRPWTTAFLPSDSACFPSSPGSNRRTAVSTCAQPRQIDHTSFSISSQFISPGKTACQWCSSKNACSFTTNHVSASKTLSRALQ